MPDSSPQSPENDAAPASGNPRAAAFRVRQGGRGPCRVRPAIHRTGGPLPCPPTEPDDMPLVVLIGASGSGKTTIARAIEERAAGTLDVFFFDRIGVPSPEAMIAAYGSGAAWQRAKTIEWMIKLAPAAAAERKVLFEGQTRLSFLAEGAAAAGGVGYRPILVDCDEAARAKRLTERGQPELADGDMNNWARYLRAEAKAAGCDTLDTSCLALEDALAFVMARLDAPLC
jgi:hypothetical protein